MYSVENILNHSYPRFASTITTTTAYFSACFAVFRHFYIACRPFYIACRPTDDFSFSLTLESEVK